MQTFYEKRNEDLYCRDSRRASKTMGYTSHLHYHIELGFVYRGHTRVTVDSVEYDVRDGDVIVVFPNQIHRFETVEKEQYVLLIVNPDLLPELDSVFSGSLPASNLLQGAAEDEELIALIRRISDTYYGEEPYKDVLLRGYLLAFFGKLFQKIELKEVQSRDYHVLGMILNYCITHSDKNLSLGILERELHISKYYISHTMSNKLHMGFNDYINSLRVSNACKHLIKGERTITEISEIVGFNTMRTFNRAFVKQCYRFRKA
ncbi:MAG: helix-turn-helix domain-containing protein, partial [Clostridia bacterium]|nr:helix-turn-helix domain-containing protein [Clostridia bacterium]